jgi:hypothetical protein
MEIGDCPARYKSGSDRCREIVDRDSYDLEAAREVTAYQEMVIEFRDAIKETAKLRRAPGL